MEEILCHRLLVSPSLGEAVLVSVFIGDEERDQLVLEQNVFLRSQGRHLHRVNYHSLEAESMFGCRAKAVKATRGLFEEYLEAEAGENGLGKTRASAPVRHGQELSPVEPPFHDFFLAGEFTCEMQEIMDWTRSPRLRELLVGLLAYRSEPSEARLLAQLFGVEGKLPSVAGR